MSLTPSRVTAIKSQIVILDAQLAKANTTYESLLDQEIESYKFDSHEGAQQAKRRSLESLEKAITRLTIRREGLIQKLNCSGVVNINVSRRGGTVFNDGF